MNKKQILKATGLSEKDFYLKYPTMEHFNKDFPHFNLGGLLSGASSGASMGSALGPWGMAAGALLGGVGNQIGDIRGQNKELASYDKLVNNTQLKNGGKLEKLKLDPNKKNLNPKSLKYNGVINLPFGTGVTPYTSLISKGINKIPLVGQIGDDLVQGYDNITKYFKNLEGEGIGSAGGYAYGGNMTESINAGGTHEENPNEGVNIGNKGLVEEGEVKFNYKDKTGENSYIFSNRIGDGKSSFANQAKSIMKKFSIRPNDKMSLEAKEQRLKIKMNNQEVVRSSMFDNSFKKAFGGGLKKYGLGSRKGEFGEDLSNPLVSSNLNNINDLSDQDLGGLTHLKLDEFDKHRMGWKTDPSTGQTQTALQSPFYKKDFKILNQMNAENNPFYPTPTGNSNTGVMGRYNKYAGITPMKSLGVTPGTKPAQATNLTLRSAPTLKTAPEKPMEVDKSKVDKGYNNQLNKLGQYGQFAGSLARLATAAQGPDAVNLQRISTNQLSSIPEEVTASNELNQVYNNLNKDIRNNAGSNAGTFLASRIASAGNQADKTGSTLSGIRSKYNEFNTRNNMHVDQFNTQTSHTEDDLRTREKDAVRTLLMDAASQAGQTNANINRDNMGYKNEQDLLGLMQSQDFQLEQDPTTGKYKLASKYKTGFGGFMYKSKTRKK